MKKLIALLLVVILMLTLAACGEKAPAGNAGEEAPGQSDAVTPNADQQDAPVGEILTVETVKAAEETPAEEFSYNETEEGLVITDYEGAGGVVVVPQKIDGIDVVEIGDKAFVNEDAVTAVRLPDTVQKVGDHAFENCTGMKVFVSGTSVKSLGSYAFNGCVTLKVVELNEGLETIGMVCFVGMGNTEIVVPASVTEVGSAFLGESADAPITIVGETGSVAEAYVAKNGENCYLVFKAK